MSNPSEKVIIVSGGSRGLGQAVVSDLLAQGHSVATFSRSSSEFVEGLANDDRFLWKQVDSQDSKQLDAFVKAVLERFGRLDGLVNNAAAGYDGLLTLMRESEIRNLLSANLESVILLTRLCVKAMLVRQGGSIVNISSVNSVRGNAGVAVYSATKAALDGLTRSLARELGAAGIRVNSVAPGFFESQMVEGLSDRQRQQIIRRTPLGRLAAAEDISAAIRFLMSEDAPFITGQTLVVDGGLTC
ncbi:MAG: SDR family oxidoreductase [Pseudomonadota bacterium]|nr:SDR family oxidoreductase [Gammaproteobacteria bacterium]MDQ3581337.1 SDR family oxidoreductase [Pseudomonadota bacterium]